MVIVPIPKENTPAKREGSGASPAARLTLPTTSGSRVALSQDEIEAEKSISGGNLSKGSYGMAEPTNSNTNPGDAINSDVLMTRIYHENVPETQATYQLDTGCGLGSNNVEILETESIETKGDLDLQSKSGPTTTLARTYSAGNLKVEQVP